MRASPTRTMSISTGPNVWCSAPGIGAKRATPSTTSGTVPRRGARPWVARRPARDDGGVPDPTDLTQCSATELVALYERGAASPVEATQAVLDRIDRLQPELNAFCFVAPDDALAAAAASADRWRRGEAASALDGVPTAIKDLVLTRGWPTLRGSRTVDPDQPWEVDAPACARLREAGAVLVGKTTTPEFGCKGETNSPLTGLTRNPWDTTRT